MSIAAPSLRLGFPSASVRVAGGALACATVAAILAGWLPVWFSIATVFLFAGPHNWIEARYFLARLPARWGRSRTFFAVSIFGAAALSLAYVAVPSVARGLTFGDDGWSIVVAAWNTAVVLWILAVCRIHSSQTSRDWGWTVPVGFALIAATWAWPYQWSLALVYVHPLVSLVFLDRELRRRPEWRTGFRLFLAALPLVVVVLWLRLATMPGIVADSALTLRITEHAGAGLLPVSSRLLVATHTFLEMVHYGVWLVAMPLVGFRASVWRIEAIPWARRSRPAARAVACALVAGAAAVAVLWVCFAADYTATRDVYFTIAVAHVLVEAPFLIRLL